MRYRARGFVYFPIADEQLLAVQLLDNVRRQGILARIVNDREILLSHLHVLSILALHLQMIRRFR